MWKPGSDKQASGRLDRETMTQQQRQMRMNIRNFLLVATPEELQGELQLSIERNDSFRADCIRELIEEDE